MNLLSSLVGRPNHLNPLTQIISPYLTKFAIQSLQAYLASEASLITLFDEDVFSSFSSDISALRFAYDIGMKIYAVEKLHAKAYIFRDFSVVGSANCTNRGLGLCANGQANIEVLVSVPHSEIAFLHQQLEENFMPIMENELSSMERRLLLTDNSRCASATKTEIADCLDQAVFPVRQPFSLYFDSISPGSHASLPASSRLLIREELSRFGVTDCFGSESSLRMQLYDFMNSQYHVRSLMRFLDNENSLIIKLLEDRHSASYWLSWMKSVNA